MCLLLPLNKFHTLFWCFHCWLWTSKCRLVRKLALKITLIIHYTSRFTAAVYLWLLQTSNFTTPWVFFTLLYKWYQIALSVSYYFLPHRFLKLCLQELHILKIFIITVVCIYYLNGYALANILPGNTLGNVISQRQTPV